MMNARRLGSMIVTLLCVLATVVCALVTPTPADAASVSQFGLTEYFSGPGEAEGAGQLKISFNQSGGSLLAVNNDSSSLFYGDVYVGDNGNNRIDRFSASGTFQLAWGWGVATGANDAQVCTTSCRSGSESSAAGAIVSQSSLAVDSDVLSPSAGDVYVIELAYNRVEKFGPSGEFLLMFGDGVNETTGGDVCDAGEKCKAGIAGSGDGQFEPHFGRFGNLIAIGPGGRVYVGGETTPRVQVFEPSGVWVQTISLSGLSATSGVSALAVNSSGDVFVKDSAATGVREFEPSGVEKSTQFDTGSSTVASIAVDGAGDVFVGDRGEDTNFGFHVLEYLPNGEIVDSFGSKTVRGGAYKEEQPAIILQEGERPAERGGPNEAVNGAEYFDAMAFSEISDSVYVPEAFTLALNRSKEAQAGKSSITYDSVWSLPVVSPVPLVSAQSATPGPRGGVVFEGVIDPEGSETTYHFEYVTAAQFEASGYSGALSTPSVKLAASLLEDRVVADVTGLAVATAYRYRLVASNSEGTVRGAEGAEGAFESLSAAVIESEYATDVASSSATVSAVANPLASATGYRFEYGTSAVYGAVVSGSLGDGSSPVSVSVHIQGLQPGTTYHYRLVTDNQLGSIVGGDRTFTTQAASTQEPTLPDGRAWELVSPPDKKGSLIEPFYGGLIQAAVDGDGIAYLSLEAIGEGGASKNGLGPSQILSSRVPGGGWRSEDLAVPHALVAEGENPALMTTRLNEYTLFSPDLERAVVEPRGVVPPLSAEADERTVYLRDNADGGFTPFVDAADVPEGTRYGGTLAEEEGAEIHYLAATPDLSHVVLEAPYPLTAEASAPTGECDESLVNGFCPADHGYNLYEWSAGSLKLIDVLPDGEPYQVSHSESAYLGVESKLVAHSISDDGRWVVWAVGTQYESKLSLYVRDMVAEKTYRVGGEHPVFQTMTSNGSYIFFLEDGELYEFDTATGVQTDVTAAHGVGANAGVQDAIMGASEDGSYVYLVAKGVLAPGGVAGQENVYELHEEEGVWGAVFVAVLSSEDAPDWFPVTSDDCDPETSVCPVNLGHDVSRVSPDGRFLEFMSDRSLTGYDNADAVSGHADEEVFLFDAQSDRLVCASCNPTGARPLGLLDVNNGISGPLVDDAGTWKNRWIAANVPGWRGTNGFGRESQYQPRFLSDSGRLFFDSADALVPQDTDGTEDVYQYEPPGVGSCTTASATFSERSDGCVGLISAGTSSVESAFLDASENGDDVFFETQSKLVAADYDNDYDVYDAHVCGAEGVPCAVEPVSPPACTTEASCRAAPTPQPEIFGPAPSATFSGAGNVVEEPVTTVKVKTKTKKKAKKPKKKRGKAKKARKAGSASKRSHTGAASGKGVER